MRIHFVGCEGASMKVLMNIAKSDGATVSGSDALLNGHRAEFAEGADEVVYSSAVPYENPELAYAREHGIKILSRAEFWASLPRATALPLRLRAVTAKPR